MWFEILKSDLKKRKAFNLILFFFIGIAAMFLSSSVNNLRLVGEGIDNYKKASNVANLMEVMVSDAEKDKIEELLKKQKSVSDYECDEHIHIDEKNITLVKGGEESRPKKSINQYYIGSCGKTYARAVLENGQPVEVKSGEIAVSNGFLKENHLAIGDWVQLKMDNRIYTYRIACGEHDFIYGGEMDSMERLLLAPEDWKQMRNQGAENVIGVYSIATNDITGVTLEIGKAKFETLNSTLSDNMYSILYVFDMVYVGLMAIVGLCLIAISLMILKFAISFSVQENYREIGLLKALGFREGTIRRIYLTKYFALVVAGACVGFAGSIPMGIFMMENVSDSLYTGKTGQHWYLNAVCSVFVILFVMWMCFLFTRKVKKFSAVEALRDGKNGERYSKRRGIWLHTKKNMGSIMYLGINDVLCNTRQYITLILTFCISFLLITIPLNTLTTMKSSEMLRKFCMDPKAVVFVDTGFFGMTMETSMTREKLANLEQELKEAGHPASVTGTEVFNLLWEKDEATVNILTAVTLGMEEEYRDFSDGEAPVLENEVAFSEIVMKENGWKIGDTVFGEINGKKKQFLITGTYTDYLQMGKSGRMAEKALENGMTAYWSMPANVYLKDDGDTQELIKDLKEKLPQYEWKTGQKIVDENVGSIQEVLSAEMHPLTGMLCILIMLIVFFLTRLFMLREKGQIAMLKSIGFTDGKIRLWFLGRFCIVTLAALMISIPLSLLSNEFLLGTIFAIMGARIKIQVDILRAYLIYPGILWVGILVAVILATLSLHRIKIQDMGNEE